MADVRKENLKLIRTLDLDAVEGLFNDHLRENARESEIKSFENLIETARKAIDRNDTEFDHHLREIRSRSFEILWRQDWFILQKFKNQVESPHLFSDRSEFERLSNEGLTLVESEDIEGLKQVVLQLSAIQIGGDTGESLDEMANILRG